MKHNISMYKKAIAIQNERRRLRETLASLDLKLVLFNKQCQHDVAFKVTDHRIRGVGIVETCYCPICGKREDIYNGHEINRTPFYSSKVVDLTKLQVANLDKALELIHDEVVENISFYYNEENTVENFETRLYDAINCKNKIRVNTNKRIIRTSAK